MRRELALHLIRLISPGSRSWRQISSGLSICAFALERTWEVLFFISKNRRRRCLHESSGEAEPSGSSCRVSASSLVLLKSIILSIDEVESDLGEEGLGIEDGKGSDAKSAKKHLESESFVVLDQLSLAFRLMARVNAMNFLVLNLLDYGLEGLESTDTDLNEEAVNENLED